MLWAPLPWSTAQRCPEAEIRVLVSSGAFLGRSMAWGWYRYTFVTAHGRSVKTVSYT